jgi:hypothetical protein
MRIWNYPYVDVFALSMFLGSVVSVIDVAKLMFSRAKSFSKHHCSAKGPMKSPDVFPDMQFCGDAEGMLCNEDSSFC